MTDKQTIRIIGDKMLPATDAPTPTPWFANGGSFGAEIDGADHLIGYTVAGDMASTGFVPMPQEGNAKRVVACVNFCEGFTNEEIEAVSLKELFAYVGEIETGIVRLHRAKIGNDVLDGMLEITRDLLAKLEAQEVKS